VGDPEAAPAVRIDQDIRQSSGVADYCVLHFARDARGIGIQLQSAKIQRKRPIERASDLNGMVCVGR
jgi:hypothetical protein